MRDNMTVRQLAEHLQLHPNTVYNWLEEGIRFPGAFKAGGGWRIPLDDIKRIESPWRPTRRA